MSRELIRKWYQQIRYTAVARIINLMMNLRRTSKSPLFLPRLSSGFETGTILSIAPHPDDDVLAVGGILYGHIAAGATVHSAVLTDGVKGTPHAEPQPALRTIRRREAEAAAERLGIQHLVFFDLPDGSLSETSPAVSALADLLKTIQPAYIYIPFPVDYHWDHLNAVRMLLRALDASSLDAVIRCYECIVPIIPNLIFDITGHIQAKIDAVRCFETQNEVTDYVNTIIDGLNRHRTHGLMRGEGYAEAVYETDPRFLRQLTDIINGR